MPYPQPSRMSRTTFESSRLPHTMENLLQALDEINVNNMPGQARDDTTQSSHHGHEGDRVQSVSAQSSANESTIIERIDTSTLRNDQHNVSDGPSQKPVEQPQESIPADLPDEAYTVIHNWAAFCSRMGGTLEDAMIIMEPALSAAFPTYSLLSNDQKHTIWQSAELAREQAEFLAARAMNWVERLEDDNGFKSTLEEESAVETAERWEREGRPLNVEAAFDDWLLELSQREFLRWIRSSFT